MQWPSSSITLVELRARMVHRLRACIRAHRPCCCATSDLCCLERFADLHAAAEVVKGDLELPTFEGDDCFVSVEPLDNGAASFENSLEPLSNWISHEFRLSLHRSGLWPVRSNVAIRSS